MQVLPPQVVDQLNLRGANAVRYLVWFDFKDPDGTPNPLGIWTGDDIQSFFVLGGAKTFYGAGTILSIENMTTAMELSVRYTTLNLSGVHPQIVNALRGRKVKLCRTYIYQIFLNPQSGTAIADPVRIFKGWLDEMELPREAVNTPVTFKIRLASNSRILTRTVPALRSSEAYRLRNGDTMLDYSAVTGDIKVIWGPTS